MRKLTLLFALLFAASAHAQVQQTGTVTAGHAVKWVGNGLVGDAGTAANGSLTTLGVTNNGGPGICINSAATTSAGYNQLCLSTATAASAVISLQNYGTATAQNLQFVINGTTYAFPGALSTITIGTTAISGGTTGDCLYVASPGVVGQQACALSSITSLTGDVTATGPGISVATLATVNANVGTFGSATLVPVITVNAKGLITAATTTTFGVTVGTTSITSGSNNGMLYNNGGVLGNLSTLASAVLVTSVGGVPSMATTLPSGLTIPTPTVTGTATFPDAATWTSTGISKAAALSVGSATLPAGGDISISGQYQVNGTQISASNLSNGVTGSGAVVLAASPTLSGTVAGSITLSGNITHSGQNISTGTSAPASAAGNSVIMGTILAPTLTNNGQTFLYNTTANGAVLQGAGSTYDVAIADKAGAVALGILTGTTTVKAVGAVQLTGLASGTCSSGLALDSGNNAILVSCPGAASAIQVGVTTVTSGSSGNILYNNAGVLGELNIASAANFESGTANKILDAAGVFTSETTTTFSATPTFDFSTFFNTKITLTANITSITCSNQKAGQSGTIRFIQDATGSRTLPATFGCNFKFAGGTQPVLTTTANAVDAMAYSCSATNYCVASLIKNVQ